MSFAVPLRTLCTHPAKALRRELARALTILNVPKGGMETSTPQPERTPSTGSAWLFCFDSVSTPPDPELHVASGRSDDPIAMSEKAQHVQHSTM